MQYSKVLNENVSFSRCGKLKEKYPKDYKVVLNRTE